MKKRKVKNAKVDQNKKTTTIRRWLFRLIGLSIPFLFFILLETGLRISGYGQTLKLFIDTPDSNNYILARPDIIKRYFAKDANIPSVTMEANLFLKNKPDNAIRIFVQGGSTAAGFPYGFGASPAGMLDQRLKQTFPDRHVEVINTAMSAINSYTLLDFVDEIIEQKPDAVLIYAGHNEFLGILGVGSNYTVANSYAANLLFLKLRKYRTFQLVQNIYTSFSSSKNENSKNDKRTMMAKVAKNKNIEKDSDVFKRGLKQFQNNLDLILSKYHDANIPVLISTIASNNKDHPPFSSVQLSDKIWLLLSDTLKKIHAKAELNQYQSDLNRLAKDAVSDSNAKLHFELAKAYESVENFERARFHYDQARENDLLRFRAPKAINQIIKSLAKKHQMIVVDYQANLIKSSANGLIGNNFMLEHLHPNLQGYFILADSFYKKLQSQKLLGSWKNSIPTSIAWQQRPIIPAEEYAGFVKIIQLKSDYPFTDKPKKVILPKPADWQQQIGMKYFSKEINWLEMLNQSYRGYLKNRNIKMILKSSQIIADAMPQNAKANFRVGQQLLQENNPKKARRFFVRAVLEEPSNKHYAAALAKSKK